MSYRGSRRQYNRDIPDRRPIESAEENVRRAIFNFGGQPGADINSERETLANKIRAADRHLLPVIIEALQACVTEQPHKMHQLAVLVSLLYAPPPGGSSGPDPLGLEILNGCWRSCRESMESSKTRELRAWVQFFSHLTFTKTVAPDVLLDFLQNIGKALDELGASVHRLVKAALCILEGLLRAGPLLYAHDSEAVRTLASAVISALPSSTLSGVNNPFLFLHEPTQLHPSTSETTQTIKDSIVLLLDSNFSGQAMELLAVDPSQLPIQNADYPQYALESVLLPPEPVDIVASSMVSTQLLYSDYFITLFDDKTTPGLLSPLRYAVRSLVSDIAESYEVNRKECAKVLLELPRWLSPRIFGQKHDTDSNFNGMPEGTGPWHLESTIIETLLSLLFRLPAPSIRPPYFFSLVVELCKLSPSTFGPAVGKCFRKLHGFVGEGLDVDIARRFGDWFAIHMSNFGFQWVWKEWIPDLELSPSHPKRLFLRRVLEIEVRLAYYDRIVRSVPEELQGPQAGVLPDSAPGPEYEFGEPAHIHYALAQEVLTWLQGRTDPAEIIRGFESHKDRLVDNGESEAMALTTLRAIVVQSLLEIGARSFSHFLNAIERYIKLMRHISTDNDARADIFDAAGKFWRKNRQMMFITFDKFMQYQFADPSDLIQWAFQLKGGALDEFSWELIRNALDKANGRVLQAQKKVVALRQEHDEALATEKAQAAATGMDVDGAKPETAMPVSTALTAATSSCEALINEQQYALQMAMEGFVKYLKSTDHLLSKERWDARLTWEESEIEALQTWGWYRHFSRTYSSQLALHSESLQTALEASIGATSGLAESLIKRYWETNASSANNV